MKWKTLLVLLAMVTAPLSSCSALGGAAKTLGRTANSLGRTAGNLGGAVTR